jgi:hypothetical protein
MPTISDKSDLGQGRLESPRYDYWHLNRPNKIYLRRVNVPYAELPDSPEESYVGNEWNVRRTFLVPWKWRHQWQFEMLGGSWLTQVTNSDTSIGWQISRMLPTAYTGMPSPDTSVYLDNRKFGYTTFVLPYAVERCCGVKPMGRMANYAPVQNVAEAYTGDYKWARITLLYKSVPYDICEDGDPLVLGDYMSGTSSNVVGYPDEGKLVRFVSKNAEPSLIMRQLQFGLYKFVELDANKRNFPFNVNYKPECGADYHLTWHNAPAVPTWARRLLGTVNSVTFADKPPGHLLYNSCQIMRYIGAHGFKQYDITYRFRYFESSFGVPVVASSLTDDNPEGLTGFTQRTSGGHNWHIRFDPSRGLVYQLATHNGKPMSEGGLPVFIPNDFRRLFRFSETNTYDPNNKTGSLGQYEHF